MTARKIIHIDMDAFYASVEQRDNPDYRGKPIVVGGRPEKRGAVAAASYEARAYGIHSAMPSRTAAQLCPTLIFIRPRFDVYKAVSQQIQQIFFDYTDLVEPLALDEAYLDVTDNKRGMRSAMAIARELKYTIRQQTQLTASAGVSVNKFLAKIASGMDKPDGLYLIAPEQVAPFIATLPIDQFYGVGEVTARKFKALGIHTGADLKQWSAAELVNCFGKMGHYYYQVSRGKDDRPVNPNRIRKSIGAEQSFSTDLSALEDMLNALDIIARQVATRLDRQKRWGYTLTLKVKYANYQQITRSRTITTPIYQAAVIIDLARSLMLTHLDQTQNVRLLGIAIANLNPPDMPYIQLELPFLPAIAPHLPYSSGYPEDSPEDFL